MKKQTCKALAEKLNKLMKELSDFDFDTKVIPYLGWFWRNVEDWESENLCFSLPPNSKRYWLDIARKWDYPSKRVDAEQSLSLLTKMIALAEAALDLYRALPEGKLWRKEKTEK